MPLVDRYQRIHTNLRISVTDRCNIRCFYCMPDEAIRFLPQRQILTFEEITRLATVFARLGIDQIRLTGGEPLVRVELPSLVRLLVNIPGVRDLALTTNGILLAEHAAELHSAGLHRLNISLDALDPAVFEQIARRRGLDQVLAGIEAAISAGFKKIRLNAVSIRGLTESEVVPLARYARARGLELRFIEYMPLDAEGNWDRGQVLCGADVRAMIECAVAPLWPAERSDPSQPAVDYVYADGGGRVGFINPVTQAFCQDCNRLRVTAEGQLRNCLFSTTEWDAKALLRGGASDDELAELIQECVLHKKPGHGIDTPDFVQPARAMYQIGG
ncbi:MAG: GTP 3',8-cyclase MoaA [Pirellulales bacterium]|nr:GTP 3',8-cyclase MoaA [Pirellulales bacterium]